jgi:hypothetical protein
MMDHKSIVDALNSTARSESMLHANKREPNPCWPMLITAVECGATDADYYDENRSWSRLITEKGAVTAAMEYEFIDANR